eukprot:CAMPEP_0171319724 /NCGR_PEP_ID=MMETSP0816-20121228/98785_1 /TAXON_ID=420281 /ORGANISM="Proboscia inermis, Strain CCAP1064/1" /LENGTH=71 /DNA_ID=CAMNT_0011815747 /DNA_START=19 /DNA_END=233 /DNA_ORIENTATION=+
MTNTNGVFRILGRDVIERMDRFRGPIRASAAFRLTVGTFKLESLELDQAIPDESGIPFEETLIRDLPLLQF